MRLAPVNSLGLGGNAGATTRGGSQARARFGQWLKLLAPGMVDAMAARVIARGR